MFDLSKLSMVELNAIRNDVDKEISSRNDARRLELVKAACDALNALHAEFPLTELRVEFECPECCVNDDIDVIDRFCGGGRKIEPDDFSIW